jgi:hypothetical protein
MILGWLVIHFFSLIKLIESNATLEEELEEYEGKFERY